MVGYILLVVFVITLSVIVFQWLRTYVPSDEALDCPEGSSLFATNVDYCEGYLNVTLKNNGRFGLAGYYIRAANSTEQSVATIDLSQYINTSGGSNLLGNAILFSSSTDQNTLDPGEESADNFNVSNASFGNITSIEVIPTRFQEENNRVKFVSCTGARFVQQSLYCGVCIPALDPTLPGVCGTRECGPAENGSCGFADCGDCVNINEVCQSSDGQCVPEGSCSDDCDTFGYECGVHIICDAVTYCGQSGQCGGDAVCNSTYQCEQPPCGNGIIDYDKGENCDQGDGNIVSGDGCSNTCQIEDGWGCGSEPSICVPIAGGAPDCNDYCVSLGVGYLYSQCPNNAGQCVSSDGDPQPGGNDECVSNGADPGDVCCCFPAQ